MGEGGKQSTSENSAEYSFTRDKGSMTSGHTFFFFLFF